MYSDLAPRHIVLCGLMFVLFGCASDATTFRFRDAPPGAGAGGGYSGEAGSQAQSHDAATDAAVEQDAALEHPEDAGDHSVDPCSFTPCNPGQRCSVDSAGVKCTNNTCADLDCGEDQRCEAHPLGGHVCTAATCSQDFDCGNGLHCANGSCNTNVCQAGARSCQGQSVFECSDNGAVESKRFSCQSAAYFGSTCVAASAGEATCSCLDDWDCPAHTTCEQGACEGTGVAPTCSLPALPFSATPPSVELHWGGDDYDHQSAHDGTAAKNPAPWPKFSHVLNTPMVANLDDDNGDGLVDELDFPEIIFIAHQGDNAFGNGIVRAIHGGGPNKGADYFARCGSKLWTEASPSNEACADGDPDADSGAPVAVADLDNDGLPEIVYLTETGVLRVLDHTGALRITLPTPPAGSLNGDFDTLTIANLDFSGYAEILIGRAVYVLGKDGTSGLKVTHLLSGTKAKGSNNGDSTMVCPADVLADKLGMEIAAGGSLYRLPDTLPTCATEPCTGSLELIWHAPDVTGNSGKLSGEGFCAIADVWGPDHTKRPGPDNRPDGKPEIILIDDGKLKILDAQTGKLIHRDDSLGGGDRGGAPNVDDFDGDGFMEIGSALKDFYVVIDLQPSTGAAGSCPDWPAVIARKDASGGAHNPNPARTPGGACTDDSDCDAAAVCNRAAGSCVCLHNGWKRDSDDDSSKATTSSVFDFNGDGAAEALYNDECDFRVYDGRSGEVLYSQISRSRTGIENPVVADVDNDGNAEVVTVMNTAVNDRCDDDGTGTPAGPNGLRVWGDPSDTWVSARRIWNQHSYHVTNITESAAVPQHAPESWNSWGGRVYNTYRSQPRSYGVAPDLSVVEVGVSSPDVQCGVLSDNVDVAFEIKNLGDLRVGPGVRVRFFGKWSGAEEALKDESGAPLERTLTQSLEPGRSVVLKAHFAQQNNARDSLPSEVRVVVDPTEASHPDGAERECREDNNSLTVAVDPGTLRPDLALELGAVTVSCPSATVETTVRNLGSAAAPPPVVRYYAGDPARGGSLLHEEQLTEPLAALGSVSFTAALPPSPGGRGAITVFAVVDPARAVDECNEANNRASAATAWYCNVSPD